MRVQPFLTAQSILYIGSVSTMSTCHCALFFMFWLLADNRCFHVWRSVTVSALRKFSWNNSDFITPTVSCWSGSRSCAATGTLCKNPSRLCWLELGFWDVAETSKKSLRVNQNTIRMPRTQAIILDLKTFLCKLESCGKKSQDASSTSQQGSHCTTVYTVRSPCFCSRA